MAAVERWYFTKEQFLNTPSRKYGIDADKELSYRQQAANFIQDMGQRLSVTQLCINTAIVYMHRFYMFHSFSKFHRNELATCALFLAAKVEEQPRKLEHVIGVAHKCLYREDPLHPKSEVYLDRAQKLVQNENIMLQTLGFDVAIDHPHTHVVKCCQMVKGSYNAHSPSKDLAQTSYIMATNSLHLTTMCLQYKPTVVACMCIHLACKWSNWEIPHSSEGKDWFWYVDKSVTFELLEELTSDFLAILEKCPNRLKRKIMISHKTEIPEEEVIERKMKVETSATASTGSVRDQSPSSLSEDVPALSEKREVHAKDNLFSNLDSLRVSPSLQPSTSSTQPSKKGTPLTYKEHKERKEREKLMQGSSTKSEAISASQGTSSFQSQQRISVPEKSVSETNRAKPVQLHSAVIKQDTSRQQTHSSSSNTSAPKHHSSSALKLSVNLERLHSSPQGQPRLPSHEPNVNPDRQYIPHGNKNHHHSSNHDRHSSKHRSHEKHEHKTTSHERPNAISLPGGELCPPMPKDRHATAVHSSSVSSSSKNFIRPHSLTNSTSSLKRPHSPHDNPSDMGQSTKHPRTEFNKSHKKTGVSSMLAGQSLLNLPMPPGETPPSNTKSGDQEPPSLETNGRPSSCNPFPVTNANHFHKSLKGPSHPQILQHSQSADILSQIQLPVSRQPLILPHNKQIPYLNTKLFPQPPIPGVGTQFGFLSMAPPLPLQLRPPPLPPPLPVDQVLPPLPPPIPDTLPPPPPPE